MKLTGKPTVDNVMNPNVVSVTTDTRVKEAAKQMSLSGIKKILVMEGDTPRGVLELFRIGPEDFDKKVSNLLLSPVAVVDSGTDLEKAYESIKTSAAVAVQKNNKIIGVVTMSDYAKSQRLL
jgi:predicted transcriptional regulator